MRMCTIAALSALFAMLGAAASAQEICFEDQFSPGFFYRMNFGAGVSTFDLNGAVEYPGGERVPFTGTLLVQPDLTVVIGISEMFGWGLGPWNHPHGTTQLVFPDADLSDGTRDTTYHGNGSPNNTLSRVALAACPSGASGGPLPGGANNVR